MRTVILILVAAVAAIAQPAGAPRALQGKPPCTETRTTKCIANVAANGTVYGGGEPGGGATTGVRVYDTAGSYQWTVPAGVNRVFCRVWGAGGGGGAGKTNTNSGGGGAGGGYDEAWLAVTPGATIAVTVGAGGAGAVSDGHAGTSGGNSVCGTLTVRGGNFGSGNSYAQPGGYSLRYGYPGFDWSGATSVAIPSALNNANGRHAGSPDRGGQGGGGADAAHAGYAGGNGALGGGGGGSGSYDTGTAATYTAAAGGSGGTNSGAGGSGAYSVAGEITGCTAGTAPGGGGGGGAATSATFSPGCSGAPGRVEIVW